MLNESLQGDDRKSSLSPTPQFETDFWSSLASWFDHPRDLLHIINVLRPPRPIVGVGHSMGATEL